MNRRCADAVDDLTAFCQNLVAQRQVEVACLRREHLLFGNLTAYPLAFGTGASRITKGIHDDIGLFSDFGSRCYIRVLIEYIPELHFLSSTVSAMFRNAYSSKHCITPTCKSKVQLLDTNSEKEMEIHSMR